MTACASSAGAIKRKCSIYWSNCTSIFENLALEEWLFRNHDLGKNGDLLLAWSNNPTVVVGRHQNPFLEANVGFLTTQGIDLARRHSGGGTVFHGRGNLNISLLTSHKEHCRPKNLRWIADALNSNFGTTISPTKRDDLVFIPNEAKVSGTAARISRGRAYHHLTLLIDEDLHVLRESLKSPYEGRIETNATRSVPAKHVGQLSQQVPGISVPEVRDILVEYFRRQFEESDFNVVNAIPDAEFPGVSGALQHLLSWDWIVGKTPRFTFDQTVQVEQGLVTRSDLEEFAVGAKFDPITSSLLRGTLKPDRSVRDA